VSLRPTTPQLRPGYDTPGTSGEQVRANLCILTNGKILGFHYTNFQFRGVSSSCCFAFFGMQTRCCESVLRRPRYLRYGMICVASGKVVVCQWCWRTVFGFHFLAAAASLDSSWLLQKARIQDAGDCKLYCLAKQAMPQWLFQVSTYPASSLSLSDPTARSTAESIGRARPQGIPQRGFLWQTRGSSPTRL
jgi:hypothetical protein